MSQIEKNESLAALFQAWNIAAHNKIMPQGQKNQKLFDILNSKTDTYGTQSTK